jgi:hypothetical protein
MRQDRGERDCVSHTMRTKAVKGSVDDHAQGDTLRGHSRQDRALPVRWVDPKGSCSRRLDRLVARQALESVPVAPECQWTRVADLIEDRPPGERSLQCLLGPIVRTRSGDAVIDHPLEKPHLPKSPADLRDDAGAGELDLTFRKDGRRQGVRMS